MKNILNLIIMVALLTVGGLSASAQISAEMRPFDFSDKYYFENGVEASLIYDRRDGADKFSVFGTTTDEKHRGVRITGTMPAYDFEGKLLFWNIYGDLFEESFRQDETGREARGRAHLFPIFKFPSQTVRYSERQAALIDTSGNYFGKNPLGLGIVVLVDYSDKASTSNDEILKSIAGKNGRSLDGTPIIRSVKELDDLTRRGLVKQTIRGTYDKSRPAYTIGRAIEDPTMGAIAPDAFLMIVRQSNGKPIQAEEFMLENFECLQKTAEFCAK